LLRLSLLPQQEQLNPVELLVQLVLLEQQAVLQLEQLPPLLQLLVV
jgi:hypothetical protein